MSVPAPSHEARQHRRIGLWAGRRKQCGITRGPAVPASGPKDAVAAGAAWAWLRSPADGYHVYERLGFRTVDSLPFWVSG